MIIMAQNFFPAHVNNIEYKIESTEYKQLKKQLDGLNKKFTTWMSELHKRVERLETNGGTKKIQKISSTARSTKKPSFINGIKPSFIKGIIKKIRLK